MTGGQIDDAQAPHADRTSALNVIAVIVRPAMANLVAHASYSAQIRRAVPQNVSCNATHLSKVAVTP